MIMQIMINLPQILTWLIRPHSVSLYQILSCLDQQKQSYGPKKLEDFLLLHMGNWAGAILLPINMATAILMYGDVLNFERL